MGSFEKQDFLNKPDRVKKAIAEEDREALRQMGKAGAKKAKELREGDEVYRKYLDEKDALEEQQRLEQANYHTHPVD